MPPQTSPEVTRLFDTPVPPKRRSVVLPQASSTQLKIPLLNKAGDPIDLTAYTGAGYTAASAVRENLARPTDGGALFSVGEILSPATAGQCLFDLPTKVVNNPGVYVFECVITDDSLYPRCSSAGEVVTTMGALDDDTYRITTTKVDLSTVNYDFTLSGISPVVGIGQTLLLKQQLVKNVAVVFSNVLYLVIERGIHGVCDVSDGYGPPSSAEVRLHLRDYPENNLLLDDYEFDEAEIALAASRVVEHYNESPPPIARRYSSQSFPSRYYWLEGICWQLCLIAANWYRRNRLPYQAGGLSVADTDKEKEYLQASAIYGESYKTWALKNKVRENADEGFAIYGSDYGWGRYR